MKRKWDSAKKMKIQEKKEVTKERVPIPRVRPTAWDTSGPRPPYWPTRISKGLEELYQPSPILFRALEGEQEDHQWYRKDPQKRPWTLVELAIDAMQMPFLLEGRAKEYYQQAKGLPPVVQDKLQSILPTDVEITRAIDAIDDGIFWKRLAISKFPYMNPCPLIQKFSYKSLFIQEWFSNYLSELEPYNVEYERVIETSKMVAPYVNILHIKELQAPIFRKVEAPRADAEFNLEDMSWLKETCLPVFPYVQRIDLSTILPHLPNLTYLSICFGFSNYERYRCFRKSRINVKDIENLFKGILYSQQIVALRIYMSAFYETDMRMAVRCLLLFPVYLTKLEISNCELDDRAGRMLGLLILYHITLKELDIKRNHLTKTGAYFIASALCMTELKTLEILNLSENGIGCIGAIYLGLMLTVNKSLQGLYLKACRIGKSGALCILTCSALNKRLKSLDISVNHIGTLSNSQEEEIVKNMKNHPKLVDLNMAECGLDPALLEFVKILGNDKTKTKMIDIENFSTILVRKPNKEHDIFDWKSHAKPTVDIDSVYSTQSGDLTSLGATITDLDHYGEEDTVPRKKLKRFMKATLNKYLVLKATQDILKLVYKMAALKAQKTRRPIKEIFEKELAAVPIDKLVKEEITKVIRRKMKKSKLFKEPEKIQTRTSVPKSVVDILIQKIFNRIPRKIVQKVIQQTVKKVQNV